MSATNPSRESLSQYSVLSFDIYGTLIDWESGIYPYLLPLLSSSSIPQSHPYRSPFPPQPPSPNTPATEHPLITAVSKQEASIQDSEPSIMFEDVLRKMFKAIAEEIGAKVEENDMEALVKSSREWAPFPDTVSAMNRLEKSGRFKFIALSNNSKAGLEAVLRGPMKDVKFDRSYSAEEIGSYKPDKKNFERVLEAVEELEAGGKENLLHCAHGVGSDQVPCEEMGIRHVWVERKVDNWRDRDREGMGKLIVVRDAKGLADLLLGV